jgi:hypothetical protein
VMRGELTGGSVEFSDGSRTRVLCDWDHASLVSVPVGPVSFQMADVPPVGSES